MSELTFADLGLAEPLLRAVADTGYTTPTPIQAQAIPQVLQGGDLLAAAQTGTGKTMPLHPADAATPDATSVTSGWLSRARWC
ncbi:DEAD/DEAH box helicase [Paludibacterium denitrificans]|uniref:DEAD/DEAH box helicase n=1 Tax=Paludibacterium denitrificans TaxID=2675226 RepID=UPI0028AB9C6F|nr:DEAD/DEAH box helicase [Paludibacterium denitrificans]